MEFTDFFTDPPRLLPSHELRVLRLRHESPTDLLVAIPAAVAALGAGVWALTQAAEKFLTMDLTREQKKQELAQKTYEAQMARLQYEQMLEDRHAGGVESQVINELHDSHPVAAIELQPLALPDERQPDPPAGA